MPQHTEAPSHFKVALLLGMTMAIGPLAIDTYLPAFPVIAKSLNVSIHEIALSISVYAFTLAVGQLVAGPLSDRLGRPTIMLTGLSIFALASLMLSDAETNEEFLALRALQAFGGGWISVCVPAIVRDRLSGAEAARFFSLIGLVMILAPAVAPGIGSFILVKFEWPAIFMALSGYAVFVAVMLKLFLFSSLTPPVKTHERINVFQRYKVVLSIRPAMRYMLLQGICFSVMLLFVAHSSFIYQEHFGTGPTEFSMLFAANIVVMMGANLANRRLLKVIPSRQILRWCVLAQGAALLTLIAVMLTAPSLWLFLPATMVIVGILGAIGPNTQACYMEYFAEHGGTASALMGATQFSLAGLITVLSALLPESVIAIVLAQGACSLVCVLLVLGIPKEHRAGV